MVCRPPHLPPEGEWAWTQWPPLLFPFDQLSEGEKQLLAVVGAIRLTTGNENLVLLDEPDTHVNPHWSWGALSQRCRRG
jgi:hypothetical protein